MHHDVAIPLCEITKHLSILEAFKRISNLKWNKDGWTHRVGEHGAGTPANFHVPSAMELYGTHLMMLILLGSDVASGRRYMFRVF